MGVSKKSVPWTSKFVAMVLQENERRRDVTFVVQTFWTPPYGEHVTFEKGGRMKHDEVNTMSKHKKGKTRRGKEEHNEQAQ